MNTETLTVTEMSFTEFAHLCMGEGNADARLLAEAEAMDAAFEAFEYADRLQREFDDICAEATERYNTDMAKPYAQRQVYGPSVVFVLGSVIEENGHDDSDWVVPVYSPDTDTVQVMDCGTTRFANALRYKVADAELLPSVAIAERVKLLLFTMYLAQYMKADESLIYAPTKECLRNGDSVVVKIAHNARQAWSECDKCKGTGAWVNLKNEADIRDCFACYGTGAKKAEGKGHKTAVGVMATVSCVSEHVHYSCRSFKRGSVTVTLRLETGEVVRLPLQKISLTRSVDVQDCMAQAHYKADAFIIPKHSGFSNWIQGNYAKEVLTRGNA